ncbi:MAG: 3-methylcrotonyl-CoA carboxylase alpha subunit [Sphingomonas bacterium]|uniref:acetyl/propionyl/methylcrotonyl-CoA carboxylase subunit alpha n=1 Tax=Sphingomonas bacterium TaxID=1895847 RepID=UPI00262307F8|nr:acetyl/propionyl/methylcrotonyl-CoA carboxylase subunit alpha [Sphingomonas bacterium]MDB5695771.1 3-methylcrotonyl-CoA carboxylase alpha subunit [Sphingomonas bacterium]
MIGSLLIANRGEIACRVIRTARRMGIRTVAVYSDADAKALHVRQADEAVHIGPSPARESYLVGERIIAAALQTGAEAIHPGYGFLSENADFAQAVLDAGLIWVGPKPASIRAMGLKDAAKARMIAAGVPVTPGYLGEDQSPERLAREADAIGYPVLIKAVAGGGGKGMRRVENAGEFADMLLSCQREAASSFGNTQVLLEKYILSPRHIEVQVFGDSHGNVVHLFERDCSLQRRHQKVIEEAPAPGMDAATREAVCGAAVRAAQAVDYEGAGTIEFIADASDGLRADRIWFMEMNTRLQVEHPVTEEITGQDLVEWQLRVASGEPLPKRQDELSIDGWAMEARLYAEDPAKGFLPSIGRLDWLTLHAGSGRVETGVEQGDEVSTFYDPMIAKLVTHARSREAAIDDLLAKLANINVWPVRTNSGFLFRAASNPSFRSGDVDTGFIGSNLDDLIAPDVPSETALEDGLAVLRYLDGDYEPDPWNGGLPGFRANRQSATEALLLVDGRPVVASIENMRPYELRIDELPSLAIVNDRGQTYAVAPWRVGGATAGAAADGAILSPMPGRVIAVEVAAGDRVAKGQKLVTLEAMKMEHSLVAPFDGTVAELNAEVGGQVSEGAVLARVEKAE